MRNFMLLGLLVCISFPQYAYADEGRVVKGPMAVVAYDDYWLATWELGAPSGTDARWQYRALKSGEDMCMVRLEAWNERYNTFVPVQNRSHEKGASFKAPRSPWQFTLTEDCQLLWENMEEQESLLHLMTSSQG